MSAFDALFVPGGVRTAVSGQAWLESMLRVERALAGAGAELGVVPAAAAAAIAAACADAHGLVWEDLLDQGRAAGNPVEPLVRALRASVGPEHERFVHLGATSQDVFDTAAVLVAGRALGAVEVDRAISACVGLAREHRSTPMVARTLLQQAVPTTFGLVAAGWLVALVDAQALLAEATRRFRFVQLGGAAGTLAALGGRGLELVELVAADLHLASPPLPWHTNRVRVAGLGAALATLAGVCGKIGVDVALLSQTEVGEVRVGAGGASSTMPQKQNPVHAVLARACAELALANASVLQSSLVQEQQRAAGAWHAEWEALCGVLAYGAGAVAAAGACLHGLVVDSGRMLANLRASDGLVLSERLAHRLAEEVGRPAALDILADASAAGSPFRDAVRADPRVPLSHEELDALLDPATYVGAADQLVDRALAYRDDELARAGAGA